MNEEPERYHDPFFYGIALLAGLVVGYLVGYSSGNEDTKTTTETVVERAVADTPTSPVAQPEPPTPEPATASVDESSLNAAFKRNFKSTSWYSHVSEITYDGYVADVTTNLYDKSSNESTAATICGAVKYVVDQPIEHVRVTDPRGVSISKC